MRGARWILLVAIAAILGGIVVAYRIQKKILQQQAPAKPQPLPAEVTSAAAQYTFCQYNGNRKIVCIQADDSRQSRDSSRVDLKGVTLEVYNKTATSYDLIKSASATFFTGENRLVSEGAVDITIGVPAEGAAPPNLVAIHTSGVTLDAASGKAETDDPATFEFRSGAGKATGAAYDPMAHELLMKRDAEVNWNSASPNGTPLKIEAGSLTYIEGASEVWLKPWGRLTRGASVVEGEDAVVHLRQVEAGGETKTFIRQIQAKKARGTDDLPGRKLQYSADFIAVDFDEAGMAQVAHGEGNAQMKSTTVTAETNVKSKSVEMNFGARDGDTMLQRVLATGDASVTSKPLPAPGRALPETHVLASQSLEMKMRDGGKEIDNVVTHAPGVLEFLPNTPAQRRRTLNGNDMAIAYGKENRIDSFRATAVKTQTDPTEEERKRNRQRAFTSSRELLARFDPKTNRVDYMEQTGDFAYDEGDRHARASKATLDSAKDSIVLQTAARMWDPAGSTSADAINLDQKTGDFSAEGNVRSSKVPDKDRKKSSDMLSGDDPVVAQARKMTSTNRNRLVHYEGGAVMTQGANRIQGDSIDVDQDKKSLAANGNVMTDLWEKPKADAAKPGQKAATSNPVRTIVHAPKMVYTDADRLALYSGGVNLVRGPLQVKSKELRAYLSAGGDSSLDKAVADGAVEILQTVPGRTRTGSGEHAEYYAADQKVILRGSRARMADSVSGVSEGRELTYFANDDRLLGSGATEDPVKTRINRGRK
jgi:lipopolysaccharide export system protein LptA